MHSLRALSNGARAGLMLGLLAATGCDEAPPEPVGWADEAASAEPASADPATAASGVATGDPKRCFERASRLIRADMKNPRAVPELRCACKGGVAEACTHLGAWHRDGIVVAKDMVKSTGYYERGCELGDGWACSDWGVALSKGRGVARDMAASHEAATRACQLGSAKGCSNAGMHLMFGRLGKQDFAAAAKLFARGCRLNDSVCCKMEAVARDPESARASFRSRCEAGSQNDCYNLAMLTTPGSKPRLARLQAACQASHAKACEELQAERVARE